MNCWPDAISREVVEESMASVKLREDITTCIYDAGAFDVLRGRGPENGGKPYALALDFLLCNFESK